MHAIHSNLHRAQLRLQIGGEAFDALPDAKPRGAKPLSRPPHLQRRPGIEKRQRIVLGGSVPAIVAAGYTVGRIAVLAVIAAEHVRVGHCRLTVGEIAKRAGCCDRLVQLTLRQAAERGDIQIKRRRVSPTFNLPNIITITNKTWIAWLRLGPRRPRPWGGGGFPSPEKNKGETIFTGRPYNKKQEGCPNGSGRRGHSRARTFEQMHRG